MGDPELLDMLAAETDRRVPRIVSALKEIAASSKAHPKRLEALRVEVHGLKGAAMVVGQDRIAELAELAEHTLARQAEKKGRLDPGQAARIVTAICALREGAQAAAEGVQEPSSVGESLQKLSA